ncbi:MAG TPA: hypothetical protein VGO93_19765 [Candidatus Xenobia bacterium]
MAALIEQIEAELTKLCPRLGQAQVQKITAAPAPPPRFVHPRPEEKPPEPLRLPGLTARYFGRSVNLDFSAWAGSACMLAIHMGAASPVKMSLVLQEGRTHGFSRSQVSTTEKGEVHAGLEEMFLVESFEEGRASQLLSDPDIEELITGLGEFERLTLHPRFFKLCRYFEKEGDITAEAIFEDIQHLQQLAEAVDAWEEPSGGKPEATAVAG